MVQNVEKLPRFRNFAGPVSHMTQRKETCGIYPLTLHLNTFYNEWIAWSLLPFRTTGSNMTHVIKQSMCADLLADSCHIFFKSNNDPKEQIYLGDVLLWHHFLNKKPFCFGANIPPKGAHQKDPPPPPPPYPNFFSQIFFVVVNTPLL